MLLTLPEHPDIPPGQELVARSDGESERRESKEDRKRRKEERRLRRDAERRPDSWERFRILIDSVKEGRQVVDLADHKARYALVIMGVLNAAVFLILSRGHLIRDLPAAGRPWLIGLLAAYTLFTFAFILHAIDCLRPRRLDAEWQAGVAPEAANGPSWLLVWESIVRHDSAAHHQAWDRVRMGQLNAEVVAVSHALARLIGAKYRALGRLYLGLVALVVLAAVILALYTYFGLVT